MNIFFIKQILYLFFYFSLKLLIICDKTNYCNSFTDCYKCVLCNDESIISCGCVWINEGCIYKGYNDYLQYENWHSKVSVCQNLDKIKKVDNIYCPNESSKKTDDNLGKDNSLKFSIYPDSKGLYGKNMVLCDFQYIQTTENDIIV